MFTNVMRRSLGALAILAFAAACGGGDSAPADEGREIELAPTPADAPLNDQAEQTPPAAAAAPAPATRAPAPAAARPAASAPAAARSGSLAAGTVINVAAGARICTNTHKVGDRFTATVTEEVAAPNGAVLPVGSEVTFEVTESARGENSQDKVKLAFKPVSIVVAGQARDLAADVTQVAKLEYVRVQSTGTQAGKVATGAAVGAVAGQLLGRDTKSTVTGAAVGAVAGGAVAAATADFNGCLPAGGVVAVTLTSEMPIRG